MRCWAERPELRDRVLGLLAEGTPVARFAAAFVLFHAERPTLRLLAPLLESLSLSDSDARWQATHMLAALGRLHGEVLPVILHEIAASGDPVRRRMALYVARELGPERPETARACLAALDDPDGDVRRAALTCFAKLHEPDPEVVTRVLEIARGHPDPRMRRIATVVLSGLARLRPERADEIRAVLDELARDADPSLARAAAVATRLGPPS